MLRIDRPVIVEGKYDKERLGRVIDAVILTTDGFGIFKKEEKKTADSAALCRPGRDCFDRSGRRRARNPQFSARHSACRLRDTFICSPPRGKREAQSGPFQRGGARCGGNGRKNAGTIVFTVCGRRKIRAAYRNGSYKSPFLCRRLFRLCRQCRAAQSAFKAMRSAG